MNERYLFRGKRKDNGEWVTGYLIQGNNTYIVTPEAIYYMVVSISYMASVEFVEVIPETVGRCSGEKDKNGKLIFEGDILRLNGNKKDLCIVCFGEFGCIDIDSESVVDTVIGWYYKLIETDALSKTEPFCLPIQINKLILSLTKAEICGSVHDNPELLEVSE